MLPMLISSVATGGCSWLTYTLSTCTRQLEPTVAPVLAMSWMVRKSVVGGASKVPETTNHSFKLGTEGALQAGTADDAATLFFGEDLYEDNAADFSLNQFHVQEVVGRSASSGAEPQWSVLRVRPMACTLIVQ